MDTRSLSYTMSLVHLTAVLFVELRIDCHCYWFQPMWWLATYPLKQAQIKWRAVEITGACFVLLTYSEEKLQRWPNKQIVLKAESRISSRSQLRCAIQGNSRKIIACLMPCVSSPHLPYQCPTSSLSLVVACESCKRILKCEATMPHTHLVSLTTEEEVANVYICSTQAQQIKSLRKSVGISKTLLSVAKKELVSASTKDVKRLRSSMCWYLR